MAEILKRNGWEMEDPNFDDFLILGKDVTTAIKHEDARLHVWLSATEEALDAHGFYGIMRIEITADLYEQGIGFDDAMDCAKTIRRTQKELLKLGVPFESKYKFAGHDKREKEKMNAEIRWKFSLDELEAERRKRWNKEHIDWLKELLEKDIDVSGIIMKNAESCKESARAAYLQSLKESGIVVPNLKFERS